MTSRDIVLPILVCLSLLTANAGDFREDTPLTPELAREALDPALMCLAIYENRRVYGWEGPCLQIRDRDTYDEASGLAAGFFERTVGGRREVALCFRGSDERKDWRANFCQALFGEVPEQYQEGFNLAQLALIEARKSSPGGAVRLTLTGHSLGGGLAAFSGTFLGTGTRVFGFATAPLGTGVQQILGRDRLRAAPQVVTHCFMRDDLIPEAQIAGSRHFGRVARPLLNPPRNWSGTIDNKERLALLTLAGLSWEDSPYLSGGILAGGLLSEVMNRFARHSMDNYVGALVSRLSDTGSGINLVGEWESKGSFFQISTNTARFIMTANGHLVLDNATDLTLPIVDFNERILQLRDTGRWRFDGDSLEFGVGGIANMQYDKVSAEPDRVVQWRRARLEPDLPGLVAAFRRDGNQDPEFAAQSTALAMRGIFFLMKDKVVTWRKLRGIDPWP